MEIPEIFITEGQIRRSNGDRGAPKWIAYKGVVYDVSECARWRKEMHENLHFPGQDLTSELPDAPHGDEVFKHPSVKIVGRLER